MIDILKRFECSLYFILVVIKEENIELSLLDKSHSTIETEAGINNSEVNLCLTDEIDTWNFSKVMNYEDAKEA